VPFAARLCATPRPDWPACKPKAERQHCVMHDSSLGRLYYPARKTSMECERLVLLSSSSSQFYKLECGEAAVCAEMTYMIVRQLPKACIISIMRSGHLVFVFPRHLSLLHAATLPCMYTHWCCCWGVSSFIHSAHSCLCLFHPPSFCNQDTHTNR
jgi:hypothetical protein